MKDKTFRTQLVDDTFTVRRIIREIEQRYGIDCTIDESRFESCKCMKKTRHKTNKNKNIN